MTTLKAGRRWLLAIAFGYASLQAWVLSGQSLHLIWQGPGAFSPPFGPKYAGEWPWVVGHAVSACLLLSLGPLLLARWQFPLARGRHARLGKLYLGCAAVAIFTGLPLSSRAEGGLGATLSFYTLSAWWAWATWRAYQTARSRQWAKHQLWVRFHYALAFSAVWLRIGLGTAAYLDLEVEQVAGGLAWASWQPAMIYAWKGGLLSERKQPAVVEPAV
ncbi:MAG: DUF2306 domain-containing protein [Candidatus Eremiobacteraeota bacterium]|nr:DUF2306 domain-containing protein [Candidatus Eremiobacteraeota bacterium]MCW5866790.1 DUF2306 domain-containing protein [Candidatus Eremiobacteraeota bacterium]